MAIVLPAHRSWLSETFRGGMGDLSTHFVQGLIEGSTPRQLRISRWKRQIGNGNPLSISCTNALQ